MDVPVVSYATEKRKPPIPKKQMLMAALTTFVVTAIVSAVASFVMGYASSVEMFLLEIAKVFLPFLIVPLVLRWFRGCRSRFAAKAILVVTSFLALLVVPGYLLLAHGFGARITSADVAAIRAWRATLPASSLATTRQATMIPSSAWPPCLDKIHPRHVWCSADDSIVSITCGSGFMYWGLVVGPTGMSVPGNGGIEIEIEPGAYVYVRE